MIFNRKILFFNPYFILFYFFLNIGIVIIYSLFFESLLISFLLFLFVFALFLMPHIIFKTKNYCLALIGYLWMGYLIYFYTLVLLFLIANKNFMSLNNIIYISLISFFLVMIAYFSIDRIRIKKYIINTDKVKKGDRIVIVHISDLHWGLIVREKRLRKIVNIINMIKPEVLISSGDLIDAQALNLFKLSEVLTQIDPNTLKVTVLGNHEECLNIEEVEKCLKKADFKVLRNQRYIFKDTINILGIEEKSFKKEWLKENIIEGKYNIIVRHKPIVLTGVFKHLDLQLSGHTHCGQFFPITLLVKFLYNCKCGFQKTQENCFLNVSCGVGTWLPPLRLFTEPDICVFNINGTKV